MTSAVRFEDTNFSPFSLWLRALPKPYDSGSVSNQNLDYIWHRYREAWIITIEEKRFAGAVSFAQRDTHGIVRQLLQAGSGAECLTARGRWVRVEYRGHYVVTFEKTTPDDGWLSIDGKRRTKDDLLALLRTGRLPDLEALAA